MKISRLSSDTVRSILSIRTTLVIIAAAVAGLSLASGCNRNPAPGTTDTTQTTATTTDTTKTAATPDTTQHGTPGQITGKAVDGQKIFYSTTYGKVKDACSTCHADGTAQTNDNHIRPGHTLAGVASRTATWNGQFKGADLQKNAYGATRCAVEYLHKGKDMATAIPQSDIEALNAYFAAINSNPGAITKNITINWVTPPPIQDEDPIDVKAATTATKAIMKLPADPNSGKDVFTRACQNCHALKEKKAGPALSDAFKEPQQVAQSIRVGNAAMPFFTKDVLSDQQIADVVAYIQQQLGK